MSVHELENLFSGLIGEEYRLLKVICPEAAEMSRQVGRAVGRYSPPGGETELKVVELGCGTGTTSLALLNARQNLTLEALDNEPTMLRQARDNLQQWIGTGRLSLIEADALSCLRGRSTSTVDIVASAYTLHNFSDGYRTAVLEEIFRALKPGGLFVNGDRYALDNIQAHASLIQQEVSSYFKRIAPYKRYDVLERWIVHLFNDESPDHIMRTGPALEHMKRLGFATIAVNHRNGVNALVTANKPAGFDQH